MLIAKATILPSHESVPDGNQLQHVKVEKLLSFYEARKLVETSTPVAASKLYAAAVKVSKTSIATQTDLTWPNAEDKFKKICDLEKAKMKAAKAAKKSRYKIHTGVFGFTKPIK